MSIDYTKRPASPTPDEARIDYTHSTRPRRNPTPDADGVVRLRQGESIVLGRTAR